MKKEWMLVAISVTLTLGLALALVRWLAPQLLGAPADLQLVKVSRKVPPFFENVFRAQDLDRESNDFTISDPYVVRAKPLIDSAPILGPHDLLGFRNRSIPNVADIITLGDSQTYGLYTRHEENWPSQLAARFEGRKPVLYNMSVGGWGAAEYWDIFQKALFLRPRVVIVAFYTGNDPLETFVKVYGNEHWRDWRLDKSISGADAPIVVFPTQESDIWRVGFRDGTKTAFTPKLRYASNQDHPAVRTGYGIMEKVSAKMVELAGRNGVATVFTIIPTKELVFAARIAREGIDPDPVFVKLVSSEQANISRLAGHLRSLPGAFYVDLTGALQEGAGTGSSFYLPDENGHPLEGAHEVIAGEIFAKVRAIYKPVPEGAVYVPFGSSAAGGRLYFVNGGRYWTFADIDLVWANGWVAGSIATASLRDISTLAYAGIISGIDPERYGPARFSPRGSNRLPSETSDRGEGDEDNAIR